MKEKQRSIVYAAVVIISVLGSAFYLAHRHPDLPLWQGLALGGVLGLIFSVIFLAVFYRLERAGYLNPGRREP